MLHFRQRIEAKHSNILFDCSGDSIDLAIEYYPEIFERDRHHVVRAENAMKYLGSEYYKSHFMSHIPQRIIKVLENADKKIREREA